MPVGRQPLTRDAILRFKQTRSLAPGSPTSNGADLLTERFNLHSISVGVYVVDASGRELRPVVLGTNFRSDDRKAPNTPSRTLRDLSRERGSVTGLIQATSRTEP